MADNDICENCKKEILVSIFKGTGICSVNCSKALAGEAQVPNAS
jgi:ribosomal protein L37AE/L43A